MSNYVAFYERELSKTGIRPGELAIFTGTVREGFRDGPSTNSDPRNAYTYLWRGGGAEDLDARFALEGAQGCDDDRNRYVLKIEAADEQWSFIRNERGDRIRQVAGPAKPIVICNIGADTIWMDTFLGKYSIPAGMCLRLDENAPQRKKKKALLTFGGEPRVSALILDGERWRPMDICADGRVKDGTFVVQTVRKWAGIELEDTSSDPDHEIYIRSVLDDPIGEPVQFYGVGMRDDGLGRKRNVFWAKKGIVYDLQKLRQAPTLGLMEQCTAELPYLPALPDLKGEADTAEEEIAEAGADTGGFDPPARLAPPELPDDPAGEDVPWSEAAEGGSDAGASALPGPPGLERPVVFPEVEAPWPELPEI